MKTGLEKVTAAVLCIAAFLVMWAMTGPMSDLAHGQQVVVDDTQRLLEAENRVFRATIEQQKRKIGELESANAALEKRLALLEEQLAKADLERNTAPVALTPPITATTRAVDKGDSRALSTVKITEDMSVTITAAWACKYPITNLIAKTVSCTDEEVLVVVVRVVNHSDRKKGSYHSWAKNTMIFDPDTASLLTASLMDDLGNRYEQLYGIDLRREAYGRTLTESMYPGDAVTDVLLFERPVGRAKTLILTLPAINVADAEEVMDKKVKVTIPISRIEKPVWFRDGKVVAGLDAALKAKE